MLRTDVQTKIGRVKKTLPELCQPIGGVWDFLEKKLFFLMWVGHFLCSVSVSAGQGGQSVTLWSSSIAGEKKGCDFRDVGRA